MRAEIISCGTELLLGHITDTNATFLAQSLPTLGIDLYFVSQVGDNLGRIVETLQRAWQRSDLIIMTADWVPPRTILPARPSAPCWERPCRLILIWRRLCGRALPICERPCLSATSSRPALFPPPRVCPIP